MNHRKLIIIIASISLLLTCGAVWSQPAGISQFVENRNGQVSVWGVDIYLHRLSFNPKIMPDQIRIIDHKYNRDMKDIMTWSVAEDKKCLHIRFKPGMGGFGTGNAVTVSVDRSAIIGEQGELFEWTIPTDIQ
jgi:hypothetical protein